MAERHPEYERHADDWYVEPAWTVDRLLDRYQFPHGLHDPCCGMETIVRTARERGIAATGADLRRRVPHVRVQDFLDDQTAYPAIVTNPPFAIAKNIIEHALETTKPGGLVCALVQAKFIYSQGRYPLFQRPELRGLLFFSRRPSMPPGEMLEEHGEEIRGGGSIDFLWTIFCAGVKNRSSVTAEWTK